MIDFIKRKRLIVLLSILVLAIISLIITYFCFGGRNILHSKTATQPVAQQTTTSGSVTEDVSVADQNPINKDSGVKWQTAVKIANPNIFIQSDNSKNGCDLNQSTTFYKIGTDNDGAEIYFVKIQCSPATDWAIMRKLNGKYEYLSKQNPALMTDLGYATITESDFLSNNTIADNSTKIYNSFVLPNVVASASHQYTLDSSIAGPDEITNPSFVEKTTDGSLMYKQIINSSVNDSSNKSDQYMSIRKFYLKTVSSIYFNYEFNNPFVKTDASTGGKNSFDIRINGASDNDYDQFFTGACGALSGAYLLNDTSKIKTRTTQVGTAGATAPIYAFNSTTDPLVAAVYADYVAGLGSAEKPDTIDQFVKANALITYQDAFGDYDLLLNEKYGFGGGCGKPVIYLYPIKTEKVSVKVGADIVKSDPAYNDGWNVVADPTGSLTNIINGQKYDSLFWEGYGREYIKPDSGFIVKKADYASTLKSELNQLGLSAKEKSDFLAFWLPKMPTSPYAKFTWLLTPEMNKLAPLTISPKPDTLIRVFLDTAPLKKPYDLKPEHLYAIPRNGFTVVEWGGLLRGDIK